MLASSVSIDAFSVGVGLGMLDFQIMNLFVFGLIAAVMMGSGLLLGSRLGNWLGDSAQVWGGLILVYLGFHFMGLI
jgi:putative Mn2+ efflux pump MntP